MSGQIWIAATMSIAGTSYPTLVSNPVLQSNFREIIIANGSAPNGLFGYAPGQANSGFSIRTMAFSSNAASMCNAILNTAGMTLAVQEGTIGGASNANCFCNRLEVTGSVNQDVLVNADFTTMSAPTTGATVAAASGYGTPLHFSDLTHIVLPGGTKTVVNQFSYVVTRRISRYDGNSPSGLPLDLAAAVTLTELSCEYEKLDDSERIAFLANINCPSTVDCSVLITQACAPNATLTLVAQAAKHHQIPTSTGSSVEDFIKEQSLVRAERGAFTIS